MRHAIDIGTMAARFIAAGLACIAVHAGAAQSSANFAMPVDAVNNGVGEMGSPSYRLFSAVGDGFETATPLASPGFTSAGGFLPEALPPVVEQLITFGLAPTIVVGGTGTVSATGGGSGNPVTFTSLTPAFCVVGASTVTGVKAGNCRIAANQAGDARYTAAPQATQDIAITASALSMVNLSVAQTATPNPVLAGRDVTYTYTVANAGPAIAAPVTLAGSVPAGASFVWASPGCSQAAGTIACNVASLDSGASAQLKVILRLTATGSIVNSVIVTSPQSEPNYTDNSSLLAVTVNAAASAVAIPRYRLYSPVTLEHHFTTDLNEYNVLGSYVGTWVQEGMVGKVLSSPGTFNGVAAVPYYRLYDASNRWHHWTTDPNEYYTLIQSPNWSGEGVDGYILPTNVAGTLQLYRLNYPALGALHHWTIDVNEYNTLITPAYGWIGEGGSGFVIQ
jgi:uncharacterized repeat protein (TIGR01451 family)